MAGILDLTGAAPRGGLLGGLNDNAILGYLAGALQGGNVGQSIGRGLEGWMQGTRLDEQRRVPAQTYAALAAAGLPDALAQALRASGIGDGELRALAQTLESSRSPAEFKAAVGRTLDLLGARLDQLQAQFRRGAKAPPALLSPRANATLDKLRQWSAGGSMPGTLGERSIGD